MDERPVPASLRAWFVIHFVIDMVFAVPLFVAPSWTLGFLGWGRVDPIMSRLAAAALFGIGIESFLGRNAKRAAYMGMLNLKIIWSVAAVAGLVVALATEVQDRPYGLWIAAALFAAFNFLWVYWRLALRHGNREAD